MKSAVVLLPGLNRDRDMIAALTTISGHKPLTVWETDTTIPDVDLIVIPGGCERYPELDADRVVHVIDLRRGATLALNGWNLTVTNTLAVAGALAAAGTETVTLLKFTCGTHPTP